MGHLLTPQNTPSGNQLSASPGPLAVDPAGSPLGAPTTTPWGLNPKPCRLALASDFHPPTQAKPFLSEAPQVCPYTRSLNLSHRYHPQTQSYMLTGLSAARATAESRCTLQARPCTCRNWAGSFFCRDGQDGGRHPIEPQILPLPTQPSLAAGSPL